MSFPANLYYRFCFCKTLDDTIRLAPNPLTVSEKQKRDSPQQGNRVFINRSKPAG